MNEKNKCMLLLSRAANIKALLKYDLTHKLHSHQKQKLKAQHKQ